MMPTIPLAYAVYFICNPEPWKRRTKTIEIRAKNRQYERVCEAKHIAWIAYERNGGATFIVVLFFVPINKNQAVIQNT